MRTIRFLALFVLIAVPACDRGSLTGPTSQPSPTAPPAPSPGPTPVPFPAWRMDKTDALNWMLGHRPEGVWLDSEGYQQGAGGHGLIAIFEGSQGSGEFFWLKLRTGNNYERFTYDSSYIYWREDHGGGLPYSAYTWTDARWLPRRLPATAYLENTENRIHWHNPGSCEVAIDNRYPVYVTFHGQETLDQGGDTGRMDVIHVSFRVSASPYSEHYWYSWDWGWVRWEYRRDGEPNARSVSAFMHRGTGPTALEEPCR